MEEIEKQTREYLRALYGRKAFRRDSPRSKHACRSGFARLKRWLVEGPEGGQGLSPLGVKEIGAHIFVGTPRIALTAEAMSLAEP
jgi:hypothetical protein